METLKIKGCKFNRLTCVKEVYRNKYGVYWRVRCDCGEYKEALATDLKTGRIKSCGCVLREKTIERSVTHGMSKSVIYNTFAHIKQRCNNKNNQYYSYYGGRGILCLWATFEQFINDMYESYLDHIKVHGAGDTTIERVDNNGNYCKENCRWATKAEQTRNTRNCTRITFNNETKTASEWSKITGISRNTINQRLKKKWTINDALTIPPRYK